MTQREIHEECCSSEEEFYDVDDVQIRDVAQQLLNGVSDDKTETEAGNNDVIIAEEDRADTPIVIEDTREFEETYSEEDERQTPIQMENATSEVSSSEDEISDSVVELTNDMMSKITEIEEIHAQVHSESFGSSDSGDHLEVKSEATNFPEYSNTEEFEVPKNDYVTVENVNESTIDSVVIDSQTPTKDTKNEVNISQNVVNLVRLESHLENYDDETTNTVIAECVYDAQENEKCEKNEEDDLSPVLDSNKIKNSPESKFCEFRAESECYEQTEETDQIKQFVPLMEVSVANQEFDELCDIERNGGNSKDRPKDLNENVKAFDAEHHENSVLEYEQLPDVFSEITIAKTPIPVVHENSISGVSKESQVSFNQEAVQNELMPTHIISDEVETSSTTADNNIPFSDCSTHKVKVDFDGYSSGKEESLSSSTSSESFEFAEPVTENHIQDERAQALRNSIIERYPSNDTDDDELDSVGDEFDEDLLAVKQISAEVEQLVAAINAFGRDEEQQMSAYMVGKKMAAEKKRKSAMDTTAMTSSCQDQTVQTDNNSFILVDRHVPEVMESLQVEIDRLQGDLEKVKSGEKELLQINSKLKEELEESQQTIDGIEIEAEQQYTELTSEIDELCEIVQRKDQELAILKEKVTNVINIENSLKDDVDSQKVIVQRQKEIIENLREELDAITKKLGEVTKLRDKAVEEATLYKMKNMERDRFLSREAQMSMEIEDLQRELNKQKLILNQTSMAKLADTFDRKVLHLENELRERDMLICKQNQIINSHRKSPTGSVITHRKMQPRASVLAAAGNLPSAGSSSESFQNGLDVEAREALLSFILSDRHNQLANIYNIGRILDLTPQEERSVERHLTKDRFT